MLLTLTLSVVGYSGMNPITKQPYCTFPECATAKAHYEITRRLRYAATVSFLLCILMSFWVGYREIYTRQLEVENMRLVALVQFLTASNENSTLKDSQLKGIQIIGQTPWFNQSIGQNPDGHASH